SCLIHPGPAFIRGSCSFLPGPPARGHLLFSRGGPVQGSREELVEGMQTSGGQTRIVLNQPVLKELLPGIPRLLPLSASFPPLQTTPTEVGAPRRGGDLVTLSEEGRLKLAQQGLAVLMQQEERARMVREKQAAVLPEQQQQEMAKMGSPVPRPLLATRVAVPVGPPSPGVPVGAPGPRPRSPPPSPGGENRETDYPSVGPKTPRALERSLQRKEIRQEERISVHDKSDTERDASSSPGASASEIAEDTASLSKKERNRKRRNRKKKKKKFQRSASNGAAAAAGSPGDCEKEALCPEGADSPAATMEIEYVTEEPEIHEPDFIFLKRIFEVFKLTNTVKKDKGSKKLGKPGNSAAPRKKGVEEKHEDSDDCSSDDEQKKPKLPKKRLRKRNRLTVEELKQLVARPDLVEMHDVTAQDPKLLLHLKATRNSVPVPRHWCFKRKYLKGKRGIEKPPFELPDFIKRTGIQEMREALQEREEQQTMKRRMRERVRPRTGKIDVDYQKLHDAFFKWQTKPKLTLHGDLYYEGKEWETRLKKKPGDLSDELRMSLAMPVGPNAHEAPPPWLIAMQRYGPPPSYPKLRIPGLSAPIPEGCSFGYHAGGWGKPPVDEAGKPLYGDVFGTGAAQFQTETEEEEEIDRKLWGELEPADEESSEEEGKEQEEEGEGEEDDPDEAGSIAPADSGLATPGCFSSVPAGMETPELLELRKKKKTAEAVDGGETPQLFAVLPERRTASLAGALMGSTHFYDLSTSASRKGPAAELQGVEVALGPEELELDPAAMTQKYEEHVREQQAQVQKEDFSDMVAAHAAKQKQKKRKAQLQDSRGGSKKYKEFKF
uniref:PSP proline-rich domain-containing protein n=1 Tax=Sarcophilus harrisii TaxID=9305 RepID=A0A7N4V838_SARHA